MRRTLVSHLRELHYKQFVGNLFVRLVPLYVICVNGTYIFIISSARSLV